MERCGLSSYLACFFQPPRAADGLSCMTMRTTLLLSFLVLLALQTRAQLPDYNLDFEHWDSTTLQSDSATFHYFSAMHQVAHPYKGALDAWVTPPVMRQMIQTTDAYSGQYAMVLYEWYNGAPNSFLLGNCPGTGSGISDSCVNECPQALYGISGFYKFYPDSLIPAVPKLIVKTYRNNGSNHPQLSSRDTFNFQPAASYTYFNLYLQNPGVANPDSFAVRFEINTLGMGSTIYAYANFLYLDNLSFHYSPYVATGVSDPPAKPARIVYDPVQRIISIQQMNPDDVRAVSIFDIAGREVRKCSGAFSRCSVSDLPAGLYVIKMVTPNSNFAEKLIIE